MREQTPIKTVVVDDNARAIHLLQEKLSVFPEIKICAFGANYQQIQSILQTEKPELVFWDIEISDQQDLQLLYDMYQQGVHFKVIFYTRSNANALHLPGDSTFNYCMNPIESVDLGNAIRQYEIQRDQKEALAALPPTTGNRKKINPFLAFETNIGVCFWSEEDILLFRCVPEKEGEKAHWEMLLTDSSIEKLSRRMTAERILLKLSTNCFVQINQSYILNLKYVDRVELKTRKCFFKSPFEKQVLIFSRKFLQDIREMYDDI